MSKYYSIIAFKHLLRMVMCFKNSHLVIVDFEVPSYSEHTILNCAQDVIC